MCSAASFFPISTFLNIYIVPSIWNQYMQIHFCCRIYPSSVLKLLSLLIVLNNCKNLDAIISISSFWLSNMYNMAFFGRFFLHCNDVHLGQVRSSRRKEECHFCKMGREAPRVCIHFVRKKGSEYPKSFMHDKTATMTLNLHQFFSFNAMLLTFQAL